MVGVRGAGANLCSKVHGGTMLVGFSTLWSLVQRSHQIKDEVGSE